MALESLDGMMRRGLQQHPSKPPETLAGQQSQLPTAGLRGKMLAVGTSAAVHDAVVSATVQQLLAQPMRRPRSEVQGGPGSSEV